MDELTDDEMLLLYKAQEGELNDSELSLFNENMKSNPKFRQAFERLAELQRRTKGLYTPEMIQKAAVSASSEMSSPRLSKPSLPGPYSLGIFTRVVAYAAAIMLVLTVSYYIYTLPPALPVFKADVLAMYEGFIEDPIPATVCDTPEKFLAYTNEFLKEPITTAMEPGVAFVGWRDPGYSAGDAGPQALLLLAYAPDKMPVIVYFQPSDKPNPVLPKDSKLQLHQTSFGNITAWEVSALDRPTVLPLLFLSR